MSNFRGTKLNDQPLADFTENQLLKIFTKQLPPIRSGTIGMGDDCAAIPLNDGWLLFKTDAVVEEVHFLRNQPAAQIGWKALCRALSDIAAMGGSPTDALVTLASPSDVSISWWKEFYKGLSRAAKQYQVDIIGGETTRSPQSIFVSIALMGRAKNPVFRSGGKSGDALLVTGRLGGSGDGHHLRFKPRLAEGQFLAAQRGIHAMMDLSDGLGADLPRLAEASETGYSIMPSKLPCRRGYSMQQAISDGEDYELLIAVDAKTVKQLIIDWKKKFPHVALTEIGRLEEKGYHSKPMAGFDHFYHH